MVWLILFISGLFEVLLVVSLEKSKGFTITKYTVSAIFFQVVSIYLLSVAIQILPLNIAYAVWVAIGALGSVLYGIVFNSESKSMKKFAWMAVLVFGVILLKTSS